MSKNSSLTVNLRTGDLRILTETVRIPLRRLLGFASRINSKRGYLLISKVLGKHYPVTPRTMAWSYRALARKLLKNNQFDSSSLWIGMAETATGLGYGVYEAAYRLGVSQALFLQTTRYVLSDVQRLEFIEEHSHATDFFLYWPKSNDNRELFQSAKHLVLIDDEISTGATFGRLIAAYRTVNPRLQKVSIVSLVNFASAEHRRRLEISVGVAVEWIALMEGLVSFEAIDTKIAQSHDHGINVIGNGECKKDLLTWPGRLGINRPITLSTGAANGLRAFLDNSPDSRPILILGTGECNSPAFLLGRELENIGYRVIIQATTRSPIFVEGDIASRMQFLDNYRDGIHNFLYNINPDQYQLMVFCHETPLYQESASDSLSFLDLMKQLNAVSARLFYQDNANAELFFCRP